ncbi:MAG: hypothetical protein R3D67_21190 [Hyphomicrobiaceae bacterium]
MSDVSVYIEPTLLFTGVIVWLIAAWRTAQWLLDLPKVLTGRLDGKTRSGLERKQLMAELRARARVLEKRENELAKLMADLAAAQAGGLEGSRRPRHSAGGAVPADRKRPSGPPPAGEAIRSGFEALEGLPDETRGEGDNDSGGVVRPRFWRGRGRA